MGMFGNISHHLQRHLGPSTDFDSSSCSIYGGSCISLERKLRYLLCLQDTNCLPLILVLSLVVRSTVMSPGARQGCELIQAV